MTLKEINEIAKKYSLEASLWEKYGLKRVYINYYTGSGIRKEKGCMDVEENGTLVLNTKGTYTSDMKKIWSEIPEDEKLEEEKAIDPIPDNWKKIIWPENKEIKEIEAALEKEDLTIEEFEEIHESEYVVSAEHAGQDYCQYEGKQKYYVTLTNGKEFTVKVGSPQPEPDYTFIDSILTFQEAAQLWGLADGAVLRKAQRAGRFLDGEVRQSGATWLVTKTAMERLYGKKG